MRLTTEQLTTLGRALDQARNSPAMRCGAQLYGHDGATTRLVPKPSATVEALRRKLGEDAVVERDGIPHVVVPLGTCGAMNLGVDPETGEVACTVHGKGVR